MRKTAVITTLFVIALFAAPLGAAATGGTDAATTATCPLPTGPGSYVVDISAELMLAWDSAHSTAGPVPLGLPAGTWDVYMVSYDDHSNKTHQTQLEERWFLQGWLGESLVFTSPTTPDLPETTDVKEFFVGSVTASQPIDKVLAVHAAYPADEPHSVAPLCAAFYPSGAAPITPAACPWPAGPGVVTISTELMLAWDVATAMAGPVDFALPAGTWNVYLVSYDNHSAKTHQAQKQEQWYLEGWLDGKVVFQSPATGDLPEDTDQATFLVGSVTNATAIDQVKAFHYAYPSDEPHSVAPVCAAFVAPGTTPPGDGDTTTPPGDGDTTNPPGDGDTTTPPGDGDTTTPPGDGDTTTPPGDGDTTTPPGDGDTTNPPGDGDTTTPPGDGDTTTPPGDGDTTTPPGDGDTTTPPGDGDTTTPPGDGDTTTPPGGGAGDTGTSNSNATGTTVAAGLEGNTSQTLQQLPLTGIELETAFAALVALMFGVMLLRRAHLAQARLDRRAARVWRRQLS